MKFDEDILLAKIATVRRCTGLIRGLWFDNDPAVPRWVRLDVTVLNLQRAVEACLDMASHLIAINSWRLPASASEAIETLVDNHVLPASETPVFRAMIGFRNIAVHNYTVIDEAVVEGIVTDHLQDLDRFAARLLEATLGGGEGGSS